MRLGERTARAQSSFLATGTVNEIADATGFYGNAFWVSASICAFSWLVNLVYVYLLRYVGEADTIEKIRKRLRQKNMFSPAVLMRFPLSFWIIIAQALLFGASWGPFTHITTYATLRKTIVKPTTRSPSSPLLPFPHHVVVARQWPGNGPILRRRGHGGLAGVGCPGGAGRGQPAHRPVLRQVWAAPARRYVVRWQRK